MRQFGFILLTVVVVIVAGRCGQEQTPRYPTQTTTQVSSGEHLFEQYCARCHLKDGTGGPAPGTGLSATDITKVTRVRAELIDIISNGFGEMPGFGDTLTTQQIADIAGYVETSVQRNS